MLADQLISLHIRVPIFSVLENILNRVVVS